jgi:hypothetical protein
MLNIPKSPENVIQTSWLTKYVFPITCGALTLALLFRHQIASQFGMLIGDHFDGLIETSLLEHWFNTLKGKSEWDIVNYFYPYPDTLGYNDGFFLYGIIYSLFRFLSLDPFLSSELVNVTVRLIGFIACYCLGLRLIKMRRWTAIMGAVLFTIANNANVQSVHAQILSVCFSPILALLLWEFATSVFRRGPAWKPALWGSASGVFYGAWLLTSFYLAWFTSFFLLILAIAFICARVLSKGFNGIRPAFVQWTAILIASATTLVSLIPFLFIYLPKARETGMHPFSEALSFTPSPGDILNLGTKNLFLGDLSDQLNTLLYPGGHGGEFIIGFPPLLLLMGIAAIITIWRSETWKNRLLWRLLTIALVISLACMFRIGETTLWHLVWKLVPGAKGLRVVARNAIFLGLPIALLCAAYLGHISVRMPALALLLSAGLITEEISNANITRLDRPVELRFAEAITPPPSTCRAFFTVGQRQINHRNQILSNIDNLYPQNVDAMFIAEFRNIRTINGFSTFNPPDWNFAFTPTDTYNQRVKEYSIRHNITEGLCSFNLAKATWNDKPFDS